MRNSYVDETMIVSFLSPFILPQLSPALIDPVRRREIKAFLKLPGSFDNATNISDV